MVHALVRRVIVSALGILLGGIATGMYIGARHGPGPRDGLMTGLAGRTGHSIRLVRTGLEATVLVAGWLEAILEVGREPRDQIDELPRHLLAARVPAADDVVRSVLPEDARRVLAGRRRRRIVQCLHVDLAEADGRLAAGAALEGGLCVLEAAGHVDRPSCHEGLARRGTVRSVCRWY